MPKDPNMKSAPPAGDPRERLARWFDDATMRREMAGVDELLDVSGEIMAAFERDIESSPEHRLVQEIPLLVDDTSHSETILHVFPDRRALLEISIHGAGHCFVNFMTALETRERLRSEAAGVLEEIERLQRHVRRIGRLANLRCAGTRRPRPAA